MLKQILFLDTWILFQRFTKEDCCFSTNFLAFDGINHLYYSNWRRTFLYLCMAAGFNYFNGLYIACCLCILNVQQPLLRLNKWKSNC